MASCDVFISYTHRDNRKLVGEPYGWIDRFHEALSARLDGLCGRDVQIWRDEKIGGADMLTPTIAEAVEAAAVLVTVVSPSYLNSEWCTKERGLFLAAAQKTGGLQTGTKSRIVKVMKTPIGARGEHAKEPEFAESIGFEFYRLNAKGVPYEFDPRLGSEAYRDFLSVINELAYGLSHVLASLGAASPIRNVAQPTGKTVFLAATTYDLAEPYESLRRELEQFGHAVLPLQPIPLLPDYEIRVREQLAQCDMSIHPVGITYAAIPEGHSRSIAELQYELAGERAAKSPSFARLTWMPPGAEAADERQRAFQKSVADDPQLFITSVETVKTEIAERLRPQPTKAPTVLRVPGDCQCLYLVYDPTDETSASRVGDWLFDEGFEVTHSLLAGSEVELRTDHEEALKLSDAVLIYYGNASEFWLRSKLRDLQKAIGYGRNRPFDARAVLIADPRRPDKDRFRSRDVIAIDALGELSPAKLAPFIDQLHLSRSEAV